MKRILLIFTLLFSTFFAQGQYSIPQNIGSSNTLVQVPANGGFKASLINRGFTDTTAANLTPIDYYAGSQIFTTSDNQFWVRDATAQYWINITAGGNAADLVPFYGCVKGCTVTWIENYDYEVVASVYYIGGVRYESEATTVTLDPADPTNDRIDVFVVDTTGVADKVTGTPDPDVPIEPAVNALSQLRISFALVTAGSTEPGITNLWLYREDDGCNTEWDFTTAAGSINLASTNNPYAGTKDIEATNMSSGQKFEGAACDSVIMQYDALVFKIRSKAAWASNIFSKNIRGWKHWFLHGRYTAIGYK